MPRHEQKCCICNTTIQTPSDGRTVTSMQFDRLKAYLCRKIIVGTDRVHNKCYKHPAIHQTYPVRHMQSSPQSVYTCCCLYMMYYACLAETGLLMPIAIYMCTCQHVCVRPILSRNWTHLQMLRMQLNMKMKRKIHTTIRYVCMYVCT